MKKTIIKLIILAGLQFAFNIPVMAQLTAVKTGGSIVAFVGERIGITEVTINYGRPAVKGREGHVWGELVPVGYADMGFGSSKAVPWRAGANENTTIEFSTDVKIEGQPLAAGKYGFFVAYDPNASTLIFSKNSSSWGSFFYKPEEDVLRVKVKPISADKKVEWLKYEFTDETPSSAVVNLQWEKLVIPFKIEIDLVATQVASFRKELRGYSGFAWESWNKAALFCAQHNTNLNEALLWADSATSINFGGDKSFLAWSTKATILDSLGKTNEGAEAMKKGLPYGNSMELYTYGRTLAIQKKSKEALEIFKINYERHPNEFFACAGMVRGYSGIGDYKNALVFAHKARKLAVGVPLQNISDKFIKMLEEGKDIN